MPIFFCKLRRTSHTHLFRNCIWLFGGHPCSPATQLGHRAGDLCSPSLEKSDDSWHTGHYCLFRYSSSVQHIANNLAVEKCRHLGEGECRFCSARDGI